MVHCLQWQFFVALMLHNLSWLLAVLSWQLVRLLLLDWFLLVVLKSVTLLFLIFVLRSSVCLYVLEC